MSIQPAPWLDETSCPFVDTVDFELVDPDEATQVDFGFEPCVRDEEDTVIHLAALGSPYLAHRPAFSRLARIAAGLGGSASMGSSPEVREFERAMRSSKLVPSVDLIAMAEETSEGPARPVGMPPTVFLSLGAFALEGDVDFSRIGNAVRLAIRLLRGLRDKTGPGRFMPLRLGVLGFAEMLVRQWMPYDSDGAFFMARAIWTCMHKAIRSHEAHEVRLGLFPSARESALLGCTQGVDPLSSLVRPGAGCKARLHPDLERIARQQAFYSDRFVEQVAAAGDLENHPHLTTTIRRMFALRGESTDERRREIQSLFTGG